MAGGFCQWSCCWSHLHLPRLVLMCRVSDTSDIQQPNFGLDLLLSTCRLLLNWTPLTRRMQTRHPAQAAPRSVQSTLYRCSGVRPKIGVPPSCCCRNPHALSRIGLSSDALESQTHGCRA